MLWFAIQGVHIHLRSRSLLPAMDSYFITYSPAFGTKLTLKRTRQNLKVIQRKTKRHSRALAKKTYFTFSTILEKKKKSLFFVTADLVWPTSILCWSTKLYSIPPYVLIVFLPVLGCHRFVRNYFGNKIVCTNTWKSPREKFWRNFPAEFSLAGLAKKLFKILCWKIYLWHPTVF